MISFVTTRRASGIGVVAITQEPQSAPPWLTNNSAYVLAFPIGGEGRSHVQQLLNLTDEQAAYIDELPKQGTGIFRDRRFNRRYLVQVPGDLEIERLTEEEIDQLRAQQPKPLSQESSEPEPIEVAKLKKQSLMQFDAMTILEILKKVPFTHKTALMQGLELSSDRMNSAKAWLQSERLVSTISCKSKTRDAEYLVLTKKAQISLNIPMSQRIAPSAFKHALYCEGVKNWLESQGYKAIREFRGDGRYYERIDVYAEQNGRRVAYEIQLTLNADDLMANIRKCISLFRVHEVCIVCETMEGVNRAKKIVSEQVPAGHIEGITYRTISYFL
jgi:hypothetical protein